MTTTQELDQARADLADAQAELADAERNVIGARNWGKASERHYRAQVRIKALGDRVQTLAAQLDAAEEAQACRDRIEQEAAPRLHAASRALEESRSGLAAAAVAVEEALTALHHQAAAHAALVEQTRVEVAGLGLRPGTRTDGTTHANGAEAMRGVMLAGRMWWAPEPVAVLARVAQRAVGGAVGAHHPLAMRLRAMEGPDGGKLEELLRAPEKPRGRRGTVSGRVAS